MRSTGFCTFFPKRTNPGKEEGGGGGGEKVVVNEKKASFLEKDTWEALRILVAEGVALE